MSQLKTLWIMRHGLAEAEFDSDFNRALSEVGAQQARDITNQLKQAADQPQEMLVSPFRRTQDTAKIVHQGLGIAQPFETEDMLVHFADHKILGDYLLACNKPSLMIVSHMPIVARLTQYLDPGCEIFGYQTAQTVKLDFAEDGKAKVTKVYLPAS